MKYNKYDGWKEVTLSEISKEGKGNYGIGASAVEYSDELYKYLRITDITEDGKLIMSDLKSVADEKAEQYLLKPNDIVFARTGNSTGKSYFYDGSDGEFVYAGFLIKLSLDPEKVNPRFMRFYTLTEEYKGWVKSFSTGSTRGNINAQTYANMRINLPPKKQQDFIVDILSKLEEKEKLNLNIITCLKQICQSLFKRWFIDFEFTNDEGLPYKSSGGKIVESDLGGIPDGWKVGTIGDLGSVIGGGTPSKKEESYYTTNGISWITPKDLSNDKSIFIYRGATDISELGLAKSSAKLMPKGTVLFSSRAPIGYIAITGKEVTTNQGFKSIVPDKGFSNIYIYYVLHQMLPTIESNAGGTTFKEISGQGLKSIEIHLPSEEIVGEFTIIVKPLFEQIKVIEKENEKLKGIRDTLLPKLFSGEIEIPDESVVD